MEENFNYNSKQPSRPRDRSRSPRSRSPREWKRPERHAADRGRDADRGSRDPHAKIRLFVSNLPYEMRWQDLKDLFREKVGSEVSFVELYEEPDGKPSGSGVVEVKGRDVADKAIETLHRYDIKGRLMIVREETMKDRQRYMRPPPMNRDNDRDRDRFPSGGGGSRIMSGGGASNMMSMMGGGSSGAGSNLLGAISGGSMSLQLLNQLGIDPTTITNQVFVANLDYKATRQKMEEVFRIAGNVIEVDLKTDKDGRSRGMGTVRFEHPMEAVQCIALFHQQQLFDRQIAVRMDKWVDPIMQEVPNRLPVGLKGLGAGFGAGGQPLMNIAQISNTLTLNALAQQLSLANMGLLAGNMGALSSLMAGTGLGALGNLSGGASLLSTLATAMGAANAGAGGSGNLIPGLSGAGSILGMASDNLGSSGLMSSGLGGNSAGLSGLGASSFSGMSDVRGSGGIDLTRGMMDLGRSSMDIGRSGLDFGLSNSGGGGGGVGSSFGGMSLGGSAARQNFDFDLRTSSYDRGGPVGGSYDRNDRAGDSSGGGRAGDISTVFVKNIPFAWNWEDMADRFKPCGEVRTAQIKMDNGRSRGMGTVSFYSPEDARRAVAMMNNANVDGRQLEVRLDRLA